ncbi:sulfotransferase [Pelomyxa schiedti]|nr:sulfotransferase [Pelomyxa schiedti]
MTSTPPPSTATASTSHNGDADSNKQNNAAATTAVITSAASSSAVESTPRVFNVHLPHERVTQSWAAWGIDWIGWSLGRFSPFYIDIPGILAKAKQLSLYKGVAGDLSPCYRSYCLFWKEIDQNRIPPSSRLMLNSTMNAFVDSALSLTRYYTAHPEIGTTPLKPAIIIAGFPRTGTTLLQNILLCDPKSRGAFTYEMFFGAPMVPPAKSPEALRTDPRIQLVEKAMAQAEMLYPGRNSRIHESHHMGSLVQDEDTYIMSLTGQWLTHIYLTNDEALEDFVDSNKLHSYQFLRTFFQMLESGFPPQSHWVLKCPAHPLWLDSLAAGFPSGRIVFTHRHPKETIPSWCALIESLAGHCFYPGAWDRRLLGRIAKNMWKLAAERICDFQRHADPALYYNVHYLDLMEHPIETCQNVYGHFGLNFEEGLSDKMAKWQADNPQGKHGRRTYSLDMYGLDPAEIAKDFHEYIATFCVRKPHTTVPTPTPTTPSTTTTTTTTSTTNTNNS